MLINYYDCSINELSDSLHNIEISGPKENDIMYDLSKYANNFGFNRIDDYKKSDIIITNTFFTNDVIEYSIKNNIPLVKRMDGIYWKNELVYKNLYHIDAAKFSNAVIFISDYSRRAIKDLYDIEFNNYSVILNNAPDFNYETPINEKFLWATSCSNWSRYDKRLSYIIDMANYFLNDEFHLIGKCEIDLPKNIIKHGYLDRENIYKIISRCNAFISPFFRDAGSKVTCQAIKCKLPVLYVSSGGLKEIVGDNGVMMNDYNIIDFRDDVPQITDDIINQANKLKEIYNDIINNYTERISYMETLSEYFNIMKKLL